MRADGSPGHRATPVRIATGIVVRLWTGGHRGGWGRAHTYACPVKGRLALAAAIALVVIPSSPVIADARELCRFDGNTLPEISGLAASTLHEGIVWAHNDSGGGPVLYALDSATCEIRATITVRGISARDPEAIAVGTGATGAPVIWWGDIGDNTAGRRSIEIHEIPEPADLVDAEVRATTHRVRLDAPEDAEALLADGDRLWLIGKGLIGGTIWQLPAPLRSDGVSRGRAVGVEEALVTDAAMRPGGGYAVRDYSEVRIYSGLPPGDLIERMPLPEQVQGEAMTWTTDGAALIIASEGDDRLLLVPVSAPDPDPAASSSASSSALSSASAEPPSASSSPASPAVDEAITPSPVADALEPVDRVGSLSVIALAVGAGVLVVSAVAVPVIARVRSRYR